MRYVSLMITAVMVMLLTSGCQEDKSQPQPTAQKAPAETMDPAKQEGHKVMDMAHESMKETHEGMKMASETSPEASTMGQAVYEKTCSVCHATGLAGAPKLGDKEAWAPHIAEGIDHLLPVAINGEGAMPPRGGNPSLSDEELRAAVIYMMEKSR